MWLDATGILAWWYVQGCLPCSICVVERQMSVSSPAVENSLLVQHLHIDVHSADSPNISILEMKPPAVCSGAMVMHDSCR